MTQFRFEESAWQLPTMAPDEFAGVGMGKEFSFTFARDGGNPGRAFGGRTLHALGTCAIDIGEQRFGSRLPAIAVSSVFVAKGPLDQPFVGSERPVSSIEVDKHHVSCGLFTVGDPEPFQTGVVTLSETDRWKLANDEVTITVTSPGEWAPPDQIFTAAEINLFSQVGAAIDVAGGSAARPFLTPGEMSKDQPLGLVTSHLSFRLVPPRQFTTERIEIECHTGMRDPDRPEWSTPGATTLMTLWAHGHNSAEEPQKVNVGAAHLAFRQVDFSRYIALM